MVFFKKRLRGFRGSVRSVNSVAPGRKGSGTWGNVSFLKHVLVVVQVRERFEATANAVAPFIFSVDRTEEEKRDGI